MVSLEGLKCLAYLICSPVGAFMLALTPMGTATQASARSLDLLTETDFHVTVVAYGEDRALVGAEHTSFTPYETAATFDSTAAVTDGQLMDGMFCTPSTSVIALPWAPFQDTEGDVVYSAALGSSPFGEQVQRRETRRKRRRASDGAQRCPHCTPLPPE